MRILFIGIIFILGGSQSIIAQEMKSTTSFLGYKLGEKFTYHHQIVNYFEHIAEHSDRVKLVQYGQTPEDRPLIATFISTPDNLAKLERYRKNNLIKTGLLEGKTKGKQLPFIWLSYNIHGDEAAASEAALATLEALTKKDDKRVSNWLKDMIIVLDPCLNPDGRERYVNWARQTGNFPPNPNKDAYEHHQPWPGGRSNHYLFDLNRDLAWQVQSESKLRMAFYHEWMPQVHADFHEMGYHSPYFFPPAAAPLHECITNWQQDFSVHVGKNHAKYFDENGWAYYTKEIFDLLYPSYGDTYPIFNGAIGFTYEQGGSGKAALQIKRAEGDILTLKDRILHHFTVSLSTLEASFTKRKELIKEFNTYFKKNQTAPKGEYKTYVIKQSNNANTKKALLDLLDKQLIRYGFTDNVGGSFDGFDYLKDTVNTVTIEKGDIILSAYQPQSILLKVLFEPKTKLEDSLTYDLTAWALPYAFNIETYALQEKIDVHQPIPVAIPFTKIINRELSPYAFLAKWETIEDARFLSGLLKKGIKVRFAEVAFVCNNITFEPGTLVINRADNQTLTQRFDKIVNAIANEQQYQGAITVESGWVTTGKDLGSNNMHYIRLPKVALIGGKQANVSAFGSVWHFFEQELNYPVTILHNDYIKTINLSQYDVLILPNGSYASLKMTGAFLNFTKKGGKIILMEQAMELFAADRETQLGKAVHYQKRKNQKIPKSKKAIDKYGDKTRKALSKGVAGCIYRVSLDNTHPLAYGYADNIHIIKDNNKVYPLLENRSWNVGWLKKDAYVSGFAGSELKKKLPNSAAFSVESFGSGHIIYMSENPLFRGFWDAGKLLFSNAVFFVGQ